MSDLNTPLPFGLRDVKIRPMPSGSETPGAGVDLPVARTFSYSENEDFEDLRGDDGLAATHGSGPRGAWSLESGGVPLEAIAAMYGGTITESGVSPARKKVYSKTGEQQRPYFEAEGQAISDSGGDFHMLVYKCKATGEMSGEMSDGGFWLTGSSGSALPRQLDKKLHDFIQNETATDIVD